MISKIAKTINKYFLTLLIIALAVGSFTKGRRVKQDKSPLSYEQITKLQPVIIVDPYSLANKQLAQNSAKSLQNLVKVAKPWMDLGIPLLKGKTFNVIINSPGGRVSVGNNLINYILTVKKYLGIKLVCHIKQASSMAFSLAISICDKRIGLKDVKMLSHPSSYGGSVQTTTTKMNDIVRNYHEAKALNLDPVKWRKISKEQGDKVFTKEEMIKYKLIHEFQL